MPPAESIDDVLTAMQDRLHALPAGSAHRPFLATYLRTTRAVGDAIDAGQFLDPAWVQRWDVVFAELYLRALDAELAGATADVPKPWRLAFAARPDLPVLRHVLLGINAHVNFDLPQAMLAVIGPAEFDDPGVLASRREDHARIDDVLADRVAAEDRELGDARTRLDRVLTPLNRLASRRFLREARRKVWHNVECLHAARLAGPQDYRARLAELEELSARRIADLLAPVRCC